MMLWDQILGRTNTSLGGLDKLGSDGDHSQEWEVLGQFAYCQGIYPYSSLKKLSSTKEIDMKVHLKA